MKQKIILLYGLLIILITGNAQVSEITWQRCFDTEPHPLYPTFINETYCISEFNNGYLVGLKVYAESEGVSNYHGGSDAWFVCVDTLGNVIWEKCYGGSKGEGPLKIIPIDSNYCYLIMATTSTDGDVQGNTGIDEQLVWIIKIDTIGNILWQQCYGYGSNIDPRDAVLTPDGGLLLIASIFGKGENVSTYYGSNDNWLWKIDSTGTIQWETTIGTSGIDNAFKVMYTSQNTYLALCGVNANDGMSDCELHGSEYSDLDVWLVEYDLDGNILGQYCYGGTEWDNAVNFTETDDGYAIVTASTSIDGDVSGYHAGFECDIWVLVLDKEKQIKWEKCFGGYEIDYPQYITKTSDGNYVVAGYTSSNDGDVVGNHSVTNRNDIWFFETDSTREIQWQRCFGGLGYNRFEGYDVVLKKNDFNFVIAGMCSGNSGDENCDGDGYRGWIFEIKDCSHYAPAQPQQPTGKDTLCVNTDSITTYTTTPATFAWYYEWQLQPEEAGTPLNDSITTTINWNPNYEGPATLKVRSSNDCGESAWSDSLVIQTYMCLGTEENSIASNLRVYPNPATNTLIVELEDGAKQQSLLEIYNSTGSKVYSSEVENTITTIDVNSWNSGIYIVKIINTGAQPTCDKSSVGKADACASYSRKVVVR